MEGGTFFPFPLVSDTVYQKVGKLAVGRSECRSRTNRQFYFTLEAECVIVPDLRECHSPYLSNERDGFGASPS